MNGTPPWKLCNTPECMADIFKGNQDAIDLFNDLAMISQVYDDLFDEDKLVSRAELHNHHIRLLFSLPNNPLYVQYRPQIQALMVAGLNSWHAANNIEQSDDTDRDTKLEMLHISHVCRYALVGVAHWLACLIGGPDHARAHARDIQLMFHDDTFDFYVREQVAPAVEER